VNIVGSTSEVHLRILFPFTTAIDLLERGKMCTSEEEVLFDYPCPICLDNEDNASVGERGPSMCLACGQSYCGACEAVTYIKSCPTCRSPCFVGQEENFKRVWKLVHTRSRGRHTSMAKYRLGAMYAKGKGVKQNTSNALMWYQAAAAEGCPDAQCAIGGMFMVGRGIEQNFTVATKWFQLSAKKGLAAPLKPLTLMQDKNLIPVPSTGTTVIIVLLTSSKATLYNNKRGVIVHAKGGGIKPGRAEVLLDGEAKAISFKLMNLCI